MTKLCECVECHKKFELWILNKGPKLCLDCKNKPHYCQCGCGGKVEIKRGRARRFIQGHHSRVKNSIPKGSKRPTEFSRKVSQMKIDLYNSERGSITRNLISIAKKGKSLPTKGGKLPQFSGINNPNWNGGSSLWPYPLDYNNKLRKSIRNRDKSICQICEASGEIVHHIDYDKTNSQSENLLLVCNRCNGQLNHDRTGWKQAIVCASHWKSKSEFFRKVYKAAMLVNRKDV